MRLLLDTHVFLWQANDPGQIPHAVLNLISDKQNELYVSLASVWEIGIKAAIGKITLQDPLEVIISTELQSGNMRLLRIEVSHISAMMGLPFHHRDPFDRLLVAQCIAENMNLVSADGILDSYSVQRIW